MIIAYTGLPGGGKSLSAIADYVLPQLKKDRDVFCNIAGLNVMRVAAKLNRTTSDVGRHLHLFAMSFNDDLAVQEKKYWVTRRDGSRYYANVEGLAKLLEEVMQKKEAVLILDECHEYLAPENWKLLRSFLKYLSMARHYGHDVILITQHISDIWEPLRNRVHETHNFARGALGFRSQYKESVYHGWNVFLEAGYSKSRLNDKSLYGLYKSHDDGAKEHLKYFSVWKNKKLLFMLFVGALMVFIPLFKIFSDGGLFSFHNPPASAAPSSAVAPEFSAGSNVVYVKYVVCGAYDCVGTRPDGTAIKLPLDYSSGKYPIEIRRISSVQNSGGVANYVLPSKSTGGVQNAR